MAAHPNFLPGLPELTGMPANRPRPPRRPMETHHQRELSEIRQALADAVEQGSLRSVAREIGMSPTGLRGFIDGTEPYGKSIRKVRKWYTAYQGRTGGDLPAETVAFLVRTLVRRLPGTERAPACHRMLDYVAALHAEAGVEAPDWIAATREFVASIETPG
jgi:hypothetical protein